MIVPVMAISNLVLTQQIYSEETNGAHAHYREPVPLSGFELYARWVPLKHPDSVSHSCSFCIRRYSPCCKPVKPGHYGVLRPRILLVLLTLW